MAGTATPVPNPEQEALNDFAAHVGPNEPCTVCQDVDENPNPRPARFAILMLGTTSLDALSYACREHAAETITGVDEYYDAGDTFRFTLLPRY